ncbi:hypothetical protein [Fluviibacter phosphoraccumulans]|uniref:hypothetical protein n=1 Tax=Fluviibacter phosphoraccumulans TaxID=1751046 RepID=UPI0024E2070B|nr:hypothetical protein [Fluviibacter phosphoraccumulans]
MTTKAKIFEAINSRNCYSVFAHAFRQKDWNVVGRGWDETRTKLDGQIDNPDLPDVNLDNLLSIYVENILYAQKAVMVWVVEKDVAQRLFDHLEEFVQTDGNKYKRNFPFPLDEDDLRTQGGFGVPTHVYEINGAKTLIYASKRESAVETLLELDNLPDEWKNKGYVEVIGKKTEVTQVFDSITVEPIHGFVEIRIDRAKTLAEKDLTKYKEALRSRFNQRSRDVLGFDVLKQEPLNIYPALHPLYEGRAWTINRIGHQNEGGYVNSNKGRRKDDDVRDDVYHKHGEEAVASLDLWSIAVVFNSPEGSGNPGLVIDGHSKILSMQNPVLYIARILDCASEQDYRLVRDSLLECCTEGERRHDAANDNNVEPKADAAAA